MTDGMMSSNNKAGYLDNIGPLHAGCAAQVFDGVELTPWGMYGQNALRDNRDAATGTFSYTDTWHRSFLNDYDRGWTATAPDRKDDKDYTSAFWAGLPVKLTL